MNQVYPAIQYPEPSDQISLFGAHINDVTMNQAVKMIIESKNSVGPKVGYFVNANSINLAFNKPSLINTINLGDMTFADGSGMRLAARFKGISLKDNINGTDLLPRLCLAAKAHDKKLFLLGSAEGIAKRTADNLVKTYQGLQVVGSHHGYLNSNNTPNIIKQINESNANILLVGMGSPIQEQWVEENRSLLNVDIVLAVGGLFDFYSGRIPRAPSWLRELGMEWVWRLIQEPRVKFKRYVIGNPLFVFRLLLNSNGV